MATLLFFLLQGVSAFERYKDRNISITTNEYSPLRCQPTSTVRGLDLHYRWQHSGIVAGSYPQNWKGFLHHTLLSAPKGTQVFSNNTSGSCEVTTQIINDVTLEIISQKQQEHKLKTCEKPTPASHDAQEDTTGHASGTVYQQENRKIFSSPVIAPINTSIIPNSTTSTPTELHGSGYVGYGTALECRTRQDDPLPGLTSKSGLDSHIDALGYFPSIQNPIPVNPLQNLQGNQPLFLSTIITTYSSSGAHVGPPTGETSTRATDEKILRSYEQRILELEAALSNQRIEYEAQIRGFTATTTQEVVQASVIETENIECNAASQNETAITNESGVLAAAELENIPAIQDEIQQLGMKSGATDSEVSDELQVLLTAGGSGDHVSSAHGDIEELKTTNDQEWKEMKDKENAYFNSINWDDDEDSDSTIEISAKSSSWNEGDSDPSAWKDMNTSDEETGPRGGGDYSRRTYLSNLPGDFVTTGSLSEIKEGAKDILEIFGSPQTKQKPRRDDSGYGLAGENDKESHHDFQSSYARLMMNIRIESLDGVENNSDYYRKLAARNCIGSRLPYGEGWVWHQYPGYWEQMFPTAYRPKGIVGVRGYGRINAGSKLREINC